jgi:DNA repair protein RadC
MGFLTELAGILLSKFGGLGGLMRADFMELCKEYGLGMAKTAQLKAALEIGRRLSLTQLDEKYQFYFARPLTVFNVLVRLVS